LIVSDPPASFYFDLSSPEAYLAAERILHVLPGPAEWQPVLAAGLPGAGAQRG
jgi:2-hydroxychromene-2-carboxylate isomerase